MQLKKEKGIYMLLVRNQKALQHTAFLLSIKHLGYKMGINFDKDPLVVRQKNYATKIVNVYIVFDLDTCPKIPLNNFKLKNCLFGETNIIKNSHKGRCLYTGYGTAFDGADSCSLGNDFARNDVIFGVDNSSSSHADNP